MPITENELSGVYDGDVVSASGEKIGSVGQIYLDDQSGEPTFVTANTGLFGMSQSFVPLRGARVENGNVVVDFDKTTVKDAPRIDDDGSLSPDEEDRLYAYYGMGTASPDTADYGTADQTPEPGYARSDREDTVSVDSRPGARTDDLRADTSTGGRDVRSESWGDRPVGADERTAAAGRLSDDGIAREGSGGFGAVGDARDTGDDKTTPDAPPADAHRDWLDQSRGRDDQDRGRDDQDHDREGLDRDRERLDRDRDRDGLDGAREGLDGDREGLDGERDGQSRDRDAVPPLTDESGTPSRGRLRKWVMTEYEPVKSEEVYVEGQGHPGERPTR